MEENHILSFEPPHPTEVLSVLRTLRKDQFDGWLEARKIVETARTEANLAKSKADTDLKARAAALEEEAKRVVIEAKKEAVKDGFAAGLAEAAAVAEQWKNIGAELAEFARTNQDTITRCARSLAEFALREQLRTNFDFFSHYFEAWVAEFQEDSRCRGLTVHPEFVDRVRDLLRHFPTLKDVPVQGNRNLKPGDLEMDFGGGQGAEFKLRARISQVAIS